MGMGWKIKHSADAFNSKVDYNGTTLAFGNFSEHRSAALMLLHKEKISSKTVRVRELN